MHRVSSGVFRAVLRSCASSFFVAEPCGFSGDGAFGGGAGGVGGGAGAVAGLAGEGAEEAEGASVVLDVCGRINFAIDGQRRLLPLYLRASLALTGSFLALSSSVILLLNIIPAAALGNLPLRGQLQQLHPLPHTPRQPRKLHRLPSIHLLLLLRPYTSVGLQGLQQGRATFLDGVHGGRDLAEDGEDKLFEAGMGLDLGWGEGVGCAGQNHRLVLLV